MSLHLPSFLLGLATLPVVVLLAAAGYQLLMNRSGKQRIGSAHRSLSGLEPLRFTPRLMEKLRRSLETGEDHAKAS